MNDLLPLKTRHSDHALFLGATPEEGREAANYLRGEFRYRRDLVRAVMENVIANGGEFVPGPLAKARLERETAAGTPTPGPEASS